MAEGAETEVKDAAETEVKEPAETEVKEEAQAPEQSGGVDVQEAELPEVADSGATGPGGQVDILLDTTVPVSACLGQAEIEVRRLLNLGKGSVVTLDTPVGEPVDLYLRGIKFACGQLVVVGDQLGVRIQEIISPEQMEQDDSSET
jgi:flagellar motor switch protein FliN/FliY